MRYDFRTCYWFYTRSASFGEQLSETISAERLFVSGRETLSGQRRAAMAAREAFSVPGFIFVCHATASDNLSYKNNIGYNDYT